MLEVSFIELLIHSQQQINLLVLHIQSVLEEMELVYHQRLMMVVITMVEILLSQFLVELLLPKAAVVVLDMVVILINLGLDHLIMLHHKVDLVVEVHGNKVQVPHLTKAHSLVGHLTETLEVTDTLVVRPMPLVVEVELVVLVLTQQMVKLRVLVV